MGNNDKIRIDKSTHFQMCLAKDSRVSDAVGYIQMIIEMIIMRSLDDVIGSHKNYKSNEVNESNPGSKNNFALPPNPSTKLIIRSSKCLSHNDPLPASTGENNEHYISSILTEIMKDCILES